MVPLTNHEAAVIPSLTGLTEFSDSDGSFTTTIAGALHCRFVALDNSRRSSSVFSGMILIPRVTFSPPLRQAPQPYNSTSRQECKKSVRTPSLDDPARRFDDQRCQAESVRVSRGDVSERLSGENPAHFDESDSHDKAKAKRGCRAIFTSPRLR